MWDDLGSEVVFSNGHAEHMADLRFAFAFDPRGGAGRDGHDHARHRDAFALDVGYFAACHQPHIYLLGWWWCVCVCEGGDNEPCSKS